jgi:hypothetical protein
VQLEETRRAVLAAQRLEQAVAVQQPAIVVGRHRIGDSWPSTQQAVMPRPRARSASTPRALARVSSSSRSGTRVRHDARRRRAANRIADHGQRADQDVEVGRAVESEHADRAGVGAARRAARAPPITCMHRTLGQPVIVPPGNTARSAATGVTSGAQAAGHLGDDVVHVRIGLDRHEVIAPRPSPPRRCGRGRCARGRSASRARRVPSDARPAPRLRPHRCPARRGRVPAIGRVLTRRCSTRTRRSGEELRMPTPPHCDQTANGAGLTVRSRR